MRAKGQLLSTEFLLGTVIFCVLLLLVIVAFSDVNNVINFKISDKKNYEIAFTVSDMLVLSKGSPEDWEDLNISEIKIIGLAKTENDLDENKLQVFLDSNSQYDAVKSKMGVGGNELYVSIANNVSGELIGEFGIYPTVSTNVTTVTRYAVLNSAIVKVNIKVWG